MTRDPENDPGKGPSGKFRLMLLLAHTSEIDGYVCVYCKRIETRPCVDKGQLCSCGWHMAQLNSPWVEGFLSRSQKT